MAIAGALVTAPQAVHAATVSVRPAAVAAHQPAPAARASLDSATTRTASGTGATARGTHYKVRAGDTLSKIAGSYYHKASDWQWLYHENDKVISDPDVIYPGQELLVPAGPPAGYSLPRYQPRHARSIVSAAAGDRGSAVVTQSASAGTRSTSLRGTLGCSGLERLWMDAGGNSGDAVTAASIAMAESGGRQYAVSPTRDYGYWQINTSNGSLATFDAYGNARAAVILSGNGSNWSPWSTYSSGAYAGRC